jgi:hypothetical protein
MTSFQFIGEVVSVGWRLISSLEGNIPFSSSQKMGFITTSPMKSNNIYWGGFGLPELFCEVISPQNQIHRRI